jgi:hypothetical protein
VEALSVLHVINITNIDAATAGINHKNKHHQRRRPSRLPSSAALSA